MNGSQVFLRVVDGKTLWLPGHQAAPGEPTAPVAMLQNCPQSDLNFALVLFEGPVTLVASRSEASLALNAKTQDDVQVAVAEFRKRCLSDGSFMQSRRYTPLPQQQPQVQAPPVQHPYPGSGDYSNHGTSHPSVTVGQQMGMVGGYPSAAPMMGVNGAGPAIMGNFNGGYNTNSNYNNGLVTVGGIQPVIGYGGAMGAIPQSDGGPPSYPGYHQGGEYGNNGIMMNGGGAYGGNYGVNPAAMGMMMGRGGMPMMGRGMMMRGARGRGGMAMGFGSLYNPDGTPSDNSIPEDEALREAEPLEPFPVEVPEKLQEEYIRTKDKMFITTLPASRTTVWVRNHIYNPGNARRYVNCKRGLALITNGTLEDIQAHTKPVELFDRQLCSYFLAHGYCARKNCLHTHRTEEQVKRVMACRHVQLEAASKEERLAFAKHIEEREKECIEARANKTHVIKENVPESTVLKHMAILQRRGTPEENPQTDSPAALAADAHERKTRCYNERRRLDGLDETEGLTFAPVIFSTSEDEDEIKALNRKVENDMTDKDLTAAIRGAKMVNDTVLASMSHDDKVKKVILLKRRERHEKRASESRRMFMEKEKGRTVGLNSGSVLGSGVLSSGAGVLGTQLPSYNSSTAKNPMLASGLGIADSSSDSDSSSSSDSSSDSSSSSSSSSASSKASSDASSVKSEIKRKATAAIALTKATKKLADCEKENEPHARKEIERRQGKDWGYLMEDAQYALKKIKKAEQAAVAAAGVAALEANRKLRAEEKERSREERDKKRSDGKSTSSGGRDRDDDKYRDDKYKDRDRKDRDQKDRGDHHKNRDHRKDRDRDRDRHSRDKHDKKDRHSHRYGSSRGSKRDRSGSRGRSRSPVGRGGRRN